MPITADMIINHIGCRVFPLILISDSPKSNAKRQVPIASNCTGSCESTLDMPKSVDKTKPAKTAIKSPVTVERTYTNTLCTAGF